MLQETHSVAEDLERWQRRFVHYQAKLLTLSAKFSKIVTLLCHTF